MTFINIRISQFLSFFKSSFGAEHSRSIKAKKAIIYSFLFRGLSIITTLLLVPVAIDYLNSDNYGIWITISSVIAWLAYFDVGLGNGMRNKFAEALAKNDHELAKTYVSTTYALIALIFGLILVIFLIINPFLNWSQILNAPPEIGTQLTKLALIVIALFCFQILFQLISILLTAIQEAEKSAFLGFIGNLLSLVLIYIFSKTTSGNLLLAGFACSFSPVVIYFFSNVWFFNKKFKKYMPSIKHVRIIYAKDLMNLGMKFFVIQASLLIMFQASNLIIAQIFSPADVTKFNIAYRYFNVGIMLWWIILSPIWSAITEAWVKQDFLWIENIIRKLRNLWIILSLGTVLMLVFSNVVFKIWVGNEIEIPFSISVTLALYTITYSLYGIYAQFLNGVGKISLQLYSGMASIILFVPLSILLCRTTGVSGVVLANVFFNSINILWASRQYRKIIHGKASGIWNK
jgi:O-antigen/teichoic acid export membrane protein